jgi:23S rRNA A1618 N6-methylase RlmF
MILRHLTHDIGASCIYPLLGVSTNDWNFIATDIDKNSLEYAKKNVSLNSWENKIELIHIDEPTTILLIDRITGLNEYGNNNSSNETFDFCMCNPPYFSSLGLSFGLITF